MNKIHVYFFKAPTGYKWIPGDRHLIHFIKRLFNVLQVGGAEKVYVNLCKGFDELQVNYDKNLPFKKIKPGEPVIILGDEHYNSKKHLQGYDNPNPIIAGIGLITHPAEWPDLPQQYPVAKYLQHCAWANNLYIPYYGKDRCEEWPAGIDTAKWAPNENAEKKFDILLYSKLRWDVEEQNKTLRIPIIDKLNELGLTYKEVVYGHYAEQDYFKLVQQCRAMVFLCAHETQGFALCEALSVNLPVFAWDPGYCQDPNRFVWNDPVIKTTSIPYFDESCGMSFIDAEGFNKNIEIFWEKVKMGKFSPGQYILNNLTLKKSAERMLKIVKEVYK